MSTMTYAGALNSAHKLEMQRDPNIYVAGEDVGTYGGIFGVTSGLLDEFGDKRIRDTPITESAIVGTAVGAAAGGLRPVIELMFVDFIGVALDQLYNQAAKMKYMFGGKAKIPMVMRATCGAGIGAAAQHSQCLEALFMHLPGLVLTRFPKSNCCFRRARSSLFSSCKRACSRVRLIVRLSSAASSGLVR